MALRVLSLMVQTVIEGFTIGGWRHVGQFQLRNDTLIPVVSWTKLIVFVKGERDADSGIIRAVILSVGRRHLRLLIFVFATNIVITVRNMSIERKRVSKNWYNKLRSTHVKTNFLISFVFRLSNPSCIMQKSCTYSVNKSLAPGIETGQQSEIFPSRSCPHTLSCIFLEPVFLSRSLFLNHSSLFLSVSVQSPRFWRRIASRNFGQIGAWLMRRHKK